MPQQVQVESTHLSHRPAEYSKSQHETAGTSKRNPSRYNTVTPSTDFAALERSLHILFESCDKNDDGFLDVGELDDLLVLAVRTVKSAGLDLVIDSTTTDFIKMCDANQVHPSFEGCMTH